MLAERMLLKWILDLACMFSKDEKVLNGHYVDRMVARRASLLQPVENRLQEVGKELMPQKKSSETSES